MDGGTDGCNLVVFLYYILIVILMAPSLSENKHASKIRIKKFHMLYNAYKWTQGNKKVRFEGIYTHWLSDHNSFYITNAKF